MHKIAIIEKIHQDGINFLKNNSAFEFEIIEDTSEDNLIKVLPNFDACTLRVSKLNEKILSKCKNLKVISRHGVGYDNVDLNFICESAGLSPVAIKRNVSKLLEDIENRKPVNLPWKRLSTTNPANF